MSTSSITGTTVRDLAASITRQLDADKDGKLSVTEFEGFLTDFLGALKQPVTGLNTSPLQPAAAEAPRSAIGVMAGFDGGKLANTAHDTTKYQIGRILQFYPNTPAGLRDALPEIQQVAPGATITGTKGDKLDFGDYTDARGERIGVIDILQAAGLGGTAWQWIPVK